jgi:limonene-1,2-epoxide hydrolase
MAGAGIVERFLACMTDHDWDVAQQCVANDVVRVGPYGDVYEGRSDYIAMLSKLMPSLPGYHMEIRRVAYAGATAWAELTETVEIDGTPVRTPEVLAFDLDAAGLIHRIAIYIQTLKR